MDHELPPESIGNGKLDPEIVDPGAAGPGTAEPGAAQSSSQGSRRRRSTMADFLDPGVIGFGGRMRGLSLHLEACGMDYAGSSLESISRALASSFDLAFHGAADGLDDLLTSLVCLPGTEDHSRLADIVPVAIEREAEKPAQGSSPPAVHSRGPFQAQRDLDTPPDISTPSQATNPVNPRAKGLNHDTKTRFGQDSRVGIAGRTGPPRRQLHNAWLGPQLATEPPLGSHQVFSTVPMALPPVASLSPLPLESHAAAQSQQDVHARRERGYAATANRLLWKMKLIYGRHAPPDPLDNDLCSQLASLVKGLDQELTECLTNVGMVHEHIASVLSGQLLIFERAWGIYIFFVKIQALSICILLPTHQHQWRLSRRPVGSE